jgi:hypothetical protein
MRSLEAKTKPVDSCRKAAENVGESRARGYRGQHAIKNGFGQAGHFAAAFTPVFKRFE